MEKIVVKLIGIVAEILVISRGGQGFEVKVDGVLAHCRRRQPQIVSHYILQREERGGGGGSEHVERMAPNLQLAPGLHGLWTRKQHCAHWR